LFGIFLICCLFICDEGAKRIAEALKVNKTLLHLALIGLAKDLTLFSSSNEVSLFHQTVEMRSIGFCAQISSNFHLQQKLQSFFFHNSKLR
jgi:hypothetical protein